MKDRPGERWEAESHPFWRPLRPVTKNQGGSAWTPNCLLSSGLTIFTGQQAVWGRARRMQETPGLLVQDYSWRQNGAGNSRTKTLILRTLLGSLKSLVSTCDSPQGSECFCVVNSHILHLGQLGSQGMEEWGVAVEWPSGVPV